MSQSPGNHALSNWLTFKADDIDDGLAADFDGSLSGLGVELGSSTYNMRHVGKEWWHLKLPNNCANTSNCCFCVDESTKIA